MRGCKRDEKAAQVTPREFIRVWQTSASVAEVAAKVRRKKNACRVRAFRYRKLGVPLKEFPPVEVELPDWDELAEYAASLLPEDPEGDAGDDGGDGNDPGAEPLGSDEHPVRCTSGAAPA
jgi:hypothetical protein